MTADAGADVRADQATAIVIAVDTVGIDDDVDSYGTCSQRGERRKR